MKTVSQLISSCALLLMAASSAAQDCVIPPRDCTKGAKQCAELMPFQPETGLGYDNYPINGERPGNQYRSYARRDLILLVQHAAAVVACRAKEWTPGNKMPLGLGDMSEKDGAIPGTSDGDPGHPKGTHLNGRDMDIAYFQLRGSDNKLRAICKHTQNNKNVFHCTAEPDNLDVRRTALFVGTLLTSDRVRVIGVDGKVRPLLLPAMAELCKTQQLPQVACDRKAKIAAEATNTGKGWFRHHHHHLHVSLRKESAVPVIENLRLDASASSSDELQRELRRLESRHVLGHGLVLEVRE